MSEKAPAFAFTLNIPVQCVIRFVDVRPGKMWNDPKKGMIQLPAQVSLKGSFDGVDTIAFVKGKVWAVVKSLATAGIIDADQDTDALEAVTEVTSIPVRHGTTTATYAKGPKDQYANMVFTRVGQAPPAAPKRLTPEQAQSAAPRTGPLPTKPQPFDEPTDAEARMAKMDKAMEGRESDGDDGFAEFSAAVDAVERPKGKGAAIEDSYLALYSRVAERLVSVGKALEFPVDATGIQAATATIWITQKDKGLL